MDELRGRIINPCQWTIINIRIFGINLLTRDIPIIKMNSNNKPCLPSQESTDK